MNFDDLFRSKMIEASFVFILIVGLALIAFLIGLALQRVALDRKAARTAAKKVVKKAARKAAEEALRKAGTDE